MVFSIISDSQTIHINCLHISSISNVDQYNKFICFKISMNNKDSHQIGVYLESKQLDLDLTISEFKSTYDNLISYWKGHHNDYKSHYNEDFKFSQYFKEEKIKVEALSGTETINELISDIKESINLRKE